MLKPKLSQPKKKLLTQADTQPCVYTEKSMTRQDNLASQERVVVNGRHCVDTEKSLCTHGNGCVNTTLFKNLPTKFLYQ